MVSEAGCPLTGHYLQEVQDLFATPWETYGSSMAGLYEDQTVQCRELADTAQGMVVSQASQRLRAFYCLEVMYHLLLPRELSLAGARDSSFSEGFPRTREGLDQLLAALEALKKRMVVAATESDMVGVKADSTRPDAGALKRKGLDRVTILVGHIERTVGYVKTCLRQEEVSVASVGEIFAEVLHYANETLDQCVHHGRILLNISEETGITPWQKRQA